MFVFPICLCVHVVSPPRWVSPMSENSCGCSQKDAQIFWQEQVSEFMERVHNSLSPISSYYLSPYLPSFLHLPSPFSTSPLPFSLPSLFLPLHLSVLSWMAAVVSLNEIRAGPRFRKEQLKGACSDGMIPWRNFLNCIIFFYTSEMHFDFFL